MLFDILEVDKFTFKFLVPVKNNPDTNEKVVWNSLFGVILRATFMVCCMP